MIDTETLRKKVIDLAIQGKLTEQLLIDGDAETLYAQMLKDKEKLIKEGVIKKEKKLPEIEQQEIPFDIPSNWKWVRLNDMFEISGGSQPPKAMFEDDAKEGYVRLYQIRDYGDNPVPIYVPQDLVSKFSKEGDVLLARYGGSLGKVFLAHDGAYNVAIAKVVPLFDESNFCNRYFFYYFNASLYQSFIRGQGNSRSAQSGFNRDDLNGLLVPLPPIKEQKRIVDIIDAVTSILVQIDMYQQQYEDDLSVLKSKIIDAGIRGKLSKQLPEDGDAETLYSHIQEEKTKLIKEGKIKKEKMLPEIDTDEIPFEIPKNWKWVRIGDVTYNHGLKTPKNRFCYIDVGTLDNVNHRLNEVENIIEATDAPSRARKVVELGDVLYSTVRPYLHNICIVDKEFSYEPIASTAFAIMHTFEGCLVNKYLFFWLLSEWFDKYANGDSSKGTLYPAIGEKDFFNGLIPMPPYDEQIRIAKSIDELLQIIG